jgi:hypothetical protein
MRLCAASWMPAARLRHLLRNFLPALMGGGEVFFNFGKQIAFQSKLSLKGEDVPNARAIRSEASLGISQPVAMVIALPEVRAAGWHRRPAGTRRRYRSLMQVSRCRRGRS